MPRHKDMECRVRIDGVDLPEYGHEVDGDTITCFIEAQDGKPYSILTTFVDSPFPCIGLYGWIDGIQQFDYRIINQYKRVETFEAVTFVNNSTKVDYRQLKFGKIDMLEQPYPLTASNGAVDQVGSLVIRVLRAKSATFVPNTGRDMQDVFREAHGITEKDVKGKGITYRTVFDQARQVELPNLVRLDYIDTVQIPYVTFKFLYRTRATLQSLLFIPYDNNDKEQEEEDIVNDIDNADLSHQNHSTTKQNIKKEEVDRAGNELFIVDLEKNDSSPRKGATINNAIVLD